MNDTAIIGGIIILFVFLGITLPYIQRDFNQPITNNNINGIVDGTKIDNSVSILDVILSIAGMFFWTFGQLPIWLDGMFIVLRVMLVLIVARMIRGVG